MNLSSRDAFISFNLQDRSSIKYFDGSILFSFEIDMSISWSYLSFGIWIRYMIRILRFYNYRNWFKMILKSLWISYLVIDWTCQDVFLFLILSAFFEIFFMWLIFPLNMFIVHLWRLPKSKLIRRNPI